MLPVRFVQQEAMITGGYHLTTLGSPKLASPIILSSVLLQVAERSARQGQANALLFSKRSYRARCSIVWIGNRSNAAVSHNCAIASSWPRTGQIETQERLGLSVESKSKRFINKPRPPLFLSPPLFLLPPASLMSGPGSDQPRQV